jgi:hypothetical protein
MLFMADRGDHNSHLIIYLYIVVRFNLVKHAILANAKFPGCNRIISFFRFAVITVGSYCNCEIIPSIITFRSNAR